MDAKEINNTAIVVIGRNEGERLKNCLKSLESYLSRTIYVDSGSRDASVAFAQSHCAKVIELSKDIPFTAARARNEGFFEALKLWPEVKFIQFIDGDCELDPKWLPFAKDHLQAQLTLAVVCGRTREKSPKHSIYNELCDIEWNTPIGESNSCGGIALMRTDVLSKLGGFDPTLIAGEEPELCFRMRNLGFRIERLDHEMTKHDANIHSLWAYCKRYQRSGYAYAQGFYKHSQLNRKELANITLYSLAPILFLGYCLWSQRLIIFLLGLTILYSNLVTKVFLAYRKRAERTGAALLYALVLIPGKFFQFYGITEFYWNQLIKKSNRSIIEYK